MKTLIFAIVLSFVSQSSFASPEAFDYSCRVSKVLDGGDFENENDFTFEDYPHVAYASATPNGKKLIVGAFSFSEDESGQPSVITEQNLENMFLISAQPHESSQIFAVVVTGAKGRLVYHSQELEAAVEVAELNCL